MIKKTLLFLAIIIIALSTAIYIYFDVLIKNAIEKYGPEVLGSKITIENVSISFTKGLISFKDINIRNPAGFAQENIFKFEDVSALIDIQSIFTSLIRIYDITIQKPVVFYELGKQGDNLTAFRNNINRLSSTELPHKSSKNNKIYDKKVIIKHFHMQNGKITATVDKVGTSTLALPNINLNDIGVNHGGITLDDASVQVLNEIGHAVMQVKLSDLIGNIGSIKVRLNDIKREFSDDPKNTTQKILKNIFGQ